MKGCAGGCPHLPSLFVYNGGRGMGREQTELLESTLMSKGMEEIMYIIIVYGIIYIH
jgi:hypothetical protein